MNGHRNPQGGNSRAAAADRVTERQREEMIEAAVAEVVGADEAARLMALAREEPYPGERPEDAQTPREREIRALEDSLSTLAPDPFDY